ncbi:hypothetical protein L484_022052 [Morus notabilis]|uniref:Josephin-like protein n=1 Tax=Morus notabilis TaxID=981085 RepID=W9RPJ7_9ROSA|nr:hypothetical protein L484_022052 [Morus notabilis]
MSLRANIQDQPNREFMEEKSFLYERQKSYSGMRFAESKRLGGSRRFQLPKGSSVFMSVSPMRLLKHFAGHVVRTLCMVSGKRTPSPNSGKNSSSSARSKPFVAPLDSHRMEAIEDCIQFINSSCTLSRSNSTANSTN